MKDKFIWALIALNAALLIGLVAKFTAPTAQAQARRPADYLLIGAETQAGINGVVFVIDSSNGRLGGMQYDDGQKQLLAMKPIELNRVFAGK